MLSDSVSEQLQPAALLCFWWAAKVLDPLAESHLPKCFYFSSCGLAGVGLAVSDSGLCCATSYCNVSQFLLEWFWQHSEKLQSSAILSAFSSPNAPVGQDKFPKCNWIGQVLQDLGSSLCLLDWGVIPLADLNISKYFHVSLSYLDLWIRNESKLLRLKFSTSLQCTLISMALLEFVD